MIGSRLTSIFRSRAVSAGLSLAALILASCCHTAPSTAAPPTTVAAKPPDAALNPGLYPRLGLRYGEITTIVGRIHGDLCIDCKGYDEHARHITVSQIGGKDCDAPVEIELSRVVLGIGDTDDLLKAGEVVRLAGYETLQGTGIVGGLFHYPHIDPWADVPYHLAHSFVVVDIERLSEPTPE